MGPKGKTPWMTIHNEKVGDSQICQERLAAMFQRDYSSHLTIEQKAIARAFQTLVEDNLYWYYLQFICIIQTEFNLKTILKIG